jgi:NAD(P)-dependent dehydrogenase (short-subunit alcohol dehydrogenase family)
VGLLDEQVVLVTGATDGLGRGVAADLAARGATVLLHGRSDERLARTVADLRAATGSERLRAYRAGFASLAEVGALADRVLGAEPRLDALVNNAGIGTSLPGDGARMESADGHELRFAVNYLAGYLLTRRLLGLLERSTPARIVNVASAGQMPIDFDDVMLTRGYSGVRAYCQSKLAQILFTFDLADELRDRGVTATALHPATYMPTKMVLAARGSAVSTLEEGVAAVVRLVADPALDGVTGAYFDGTREAGADPQAYDEDARRALRELSDRLTGAAV